MQKKNDYAKVPAVAAKYEYVMKKTHIINQKFAQKEDFLSI